MQWLCLFLWATLTVYGGRRQARRFGVRLLLSAGLALSMLCQLWLLRLEGLLSLSTALPLHLCSLMGLLSIPMLWLPGYRLWHFSLLLGAPCAFLALCFPAVLRCSHQALMSLAFNRLHALIVCAALFGWGQRKPLPGAGEARLTLLLGSGYLVLVAALNRALGTNYLFLRAAPTGTPLEALFARGSGFYLCSLVLLAMLAAALLLPAYRWLAALGESTAKSRSAYSPYNRCTLPCTIPSRGSGSSRSGP